MRDEGCGRGEGGPGRCPKMPRRLCSSAPLLLHNKGLRVSTLTATTTTIRLQLISPNLAGILSIKDATVV